MPKGKYGKFRKVSDEERKQVVELNINHGMKIKHISELLQIKESTVKTILRSFSQIGSYDSRKRGNRLGNSTVLTESVKERIKMFQKQNPCLTYKQIADLLKQDEKEPVSKISITSIFNVINQDFSTKNLEVIPLERNSDRVLDIRKDYVVSFKNELADIRQFIQPVFIDETGFNLHLRRKRGRSLKGEKAVIQRKANRGKNISVIAAMSPDLGVVHFKSYIGSVNGPKYVEFLEELIQKLKEFDYPNYAFIMDNARTHHVHTVHDVLTGNQYILKYLPPYSPFLNPIEELFSKLKYLVKKIDFNSTETITEAVNKSILSINKENCLSWYNHSLTYFDKCENKKEIL